MKTYYFTVVFSPDSFQSFCLRSKSLKDAIKILKYCLPAKYSGEYTIASYYTVISNGKRTFRQMAKVIRGVA